MGSITQWKDIEAVEKALTGLVTLARTNHGLRPQELARQFMAQYPEIARAKEARTLVERMVYGVNGFNRDAITYLNPYLPAAFRLATDQPRPEFPKKKGVAGVKKK